MSRRSGARIGLIIVAAAGFLAGVAPPLEAQAAPENLVYVPLPPCRVADSRVATDPAYVGRLGAGVARTFFLRGPSRDYSGQGGGASGCGIPGLTAAPGGLRNEATAVAVNIVAVSPLGGGHLTAWAAGDPEPAASVINFQQLTPGLNLANGIILTACHQVGAAPCDTGDLAIRAHGAAVHVVVDVVGYFHPVPLASIRADQIVGGSGSGLDADRLDGQDASAFVKTAGDTMTGTLTLLPATGVALSTPADVDLGGRVLQAGVSLLEGDAFFNTALGLSALAPHDGIFNTAMGYRALAGSTGNANTAVGARAMAGNPSGNYNTAVGREALLGIGDMNTAVGDQALNFNQGSRNTAVGLQALVLNGAGQLNTALGYQAGHGSPNGARNTMVGAFALGVSADGGSDNIALGFEAGSAGPGTNNIFIGNRGVAAENATIRIGTAPTHTRFFAAGISAAAVSGAPVVVDANGQLGVAPSSRSMKDEIRDMEAVSQGLYQLRPVTFRYKEAVAGAHGLQYGLIAEEVAAIYPDLVQYGPDGRPQTILYQLLTPMLLNELQRQQGRFEAQEREIRELRQRVDGLSR
jgi:hypothetical protein